MIRSLLRTGQIVFYHRWLWCVDRKLDAGWRLRKLGDGQRVVLPHGDLSDGLLNGEVVMVTRTRCLAIEKQTMPELSRLALAISTSHQSQLTEGHP